MKIAKYLMVVGFFCAKLSAYADIWTDSSTGLTWTYFIVDGHAEIGADESGYYWYFNSAVSPSPTGELVVPATLGGCPVTVLRDNSLYRSNISSVKLPSTLTKIGRGVFAECALLESINIPDSVVTIGSEAFYRCDSLKSITIPESVTEWSRDCLVGCESLRNVCILSRCPPSGSSYGYIGGYYLTNITLRVCSEQFPLDVSGSRDSVTLTLLPGDGDEIPANYMSWSRLYYGVNLVIGEGFVAVGANAFRDVELSELHLPNSLRVIGDSAFKRAFSFLRYPYSQTLRLNEGLEIIGRYAFRDCELSELRFPSTLKIIGDGAFERAFSFPRYPYTFALELNHGLESIGNDAFGWLRLEQYRYMTPDQTNLKISIPNTVTNIGYNAFGYTTLDDLILESGNEHLTIQNGVLYYRENDRLSVALMGSTQTSGSLVLDEGINKIQSGAFSGCKRITDIVIPSKVTELSEYTFSQCEGVTNFVIHNGVVNISPSALRGVDISAVRVHSANPNYYVNGDVLCRRLSSGDSEIVVVSSETTELKFSDEVVSIGREACVPGSTKLRIYSNGYSVSYSQQSMGVESVSDWNNVTTIGDWAFSFTALKDLYLPRNLIQIGNYSFAWCRSLRNVNIETPVGNHCFYNCTNLYSVAMSVDVSDSAFYYAEQLRTVTLRDGVRRIESNGFGSCTNLFEIVIPSSVNYINSSAFSGCRNLTNMIFEGHVPSEFSKYVLPENCKCVVPVALKDEWLTVISEEEIECFTPSKYDNADILTDEWISKYPALSSFGNKIDIGAAYTGKVDAKGNPLQVWHDFVAGTDPTDPNDKFTAKIEITNGIPTITWNPKLPPEETALRSYKTYGKTNLDDDWVDVTNMTDIQRATYRFFTVTVGMK